MKTNTDRRTHNSGNSLDREHLLSELRADPLFGEPASAEDIARRLRLCRIAGSRDGHVRFVYKGTERYCVPIALVWKNRLNPAVPLVACWEPDAGDALKLFRLEYMSKLVAGYGQPESCPHPNQMEPL
jgi:hypothetical protein